MPSTLKELMDQGKNSQFYSTEEWFGIVRSISQTNGQDQERGEDYAEANCRQTECHILLMYGQLKLLPLNNISRMSVSMGVLPTSRTKKSCSITWELTVRSEGRRRRSLPNLVGWFGYCVLQYSSNAHWDFSCRLSMWATSDNPQASGREEIKISFSFVEVFSVWGLCFSLAMEIGEVNSSRYCRSIATGGNIFFKYEGLIWVDGIKTCGSQNLAMEIDCQSQQECHSSRIFLNSSNNQRALYSQHPKKRFFAMFALNQFFRTKSLLTCTLQTTIVSLYNPSSIIRICNAQAAYLNFNYFSTE